MGAITNQYSEKMTPLKHFHRSMWLFVKLVKGKPRTGFMIIKGVSVTRGPSKL